MAATRELRKYFTTYVSFMCQFTLSDYTNSRSTFLTFLLDLSYDFILQSLTNCKHCQWVHPGDSLLGLVVLETFPILQS